MSPVAQDKKSILRYNFIMNDRLEENKINVIEPLKFIIPECCRELWDTCPHVVKKQKRKKRNIAV